MAEVAGWPADYRAQHRTVVFSGTLAAGDVVSFSIGGTTVSHAIGYGETLQGIVCDTRAIINGLFSGVWPTITSDRAPRSASSRRRRPGPTTA